MFMDRGDVMGDVCYTMHELLTTKLYELPNRIYNGILSDLERQFGVITPKMKSTFDNANLFQLDQYINIYKYILII